MTPTPQQQQMYQSLLDSVQKRDVPFVLYHLAESKQIDPGLVNRADTVTGLIPLQFALALPFKEGRRSALILRILLLAGSQRAHSTKRKNKLDNAALDEIFRAASDTQHEADTVKLLLNELALDVAEQWLWNNELDAEEAYAATEQDRADVPADRDESSSMSEKPGSPQEPRGPSNADVTPPLAPSDSASASARPSTALSTQSPMPTPHHGTSPFPLPQPVQSFVVDCLTDRTTSDDLARFLSHALGGGGEGTDRLVETVRPTFSSGVNAFRVVLAQPVDASKVEALDNAELDGVGMRVRVGVLNSANPFAPFTGGVSPPPRKGRCNRDRSPPPRPASPPSPSPSLYPATLKYPNGNLRDVVAAQVFDRRHAQPQLGDSQPSTSTLTATDLEEGEIPPAPQTVPSSRMPDYDDGWW